MTLIAVFCAKIIFLQNISQRHIVMQTHLFYGKVCVCVLGGGGGGRG